MPAPTLDSLPASYAPFSVIVTLSGRRTPPSAIVVERANQQWVAPAILDSTGTRSDSVRFFPHGDPPLWLDRADSIDVCLVFGQGRTARITHFGRIAVIQSA